MASSRRGDADREPPSAATTDALETWYDAKRLASTMADSDAAGGDPMTLEVTSAREAAVAKVDRFLAMASPASDLREARAGVGLVVAHHVDRIGALHDAAHQCVGRVYAAGDAAIAVAIAILEQPDVAVVDYDLAVMDGLETAIVASMYAPSTAVLLLTTELDIQQAARSLGIATAARGAFDEELVTIISDMVEVPVTMH